MDEFSSLPHQSLHRAAPLHIGLLVDGVVASQYVYDFVEWARSHQIIITRVILHPRPDMKSMSSLVGFLRRSIRSINTNGLYFLISEWALQTVERLERAIIKRDKHHSRHLQKFDLSSLVQDTISVSPISDSDSIYRFDVSDVQLIKDLNLDLLLRYGSCNLGGEILNAPRLGIISVCHGDNQKNRGDPVGFWEVYFQHDTTGFTIQRLRDEVGTGQVLMRGHFATRHYYLLNQAFVLRKAHYYLRQIVERIALTGKLPNFLKDFPYSQQLFQRPGALSTVTYSASRCYSILLKRLRRLFSIAYRTNVAYVRQDWRNVELWKGVRLTNSPFHYLADPFVIYKNGKNYCFVEDFDYLKQRGSIVVYELTDAGGVRVGIALEENFHLSFPYLFEYQGELFMCPESSENRDIRIYKCIEFPLRWRLQKIAMEKISAADTMIFPKDGKWWMFTNIDPVEIGDHCSELFIFSANSPLETRWTHHPLNPVIVDASRARNAGLIVDGDTYFRCSQGQGFDFYGRRVLINKITDLTDFSYHESCSCVITPSFGAGVVGTHHLHSNGKITVFDFSTSSRISSEG
jgi:hypothetical protein